MADCQLDRRPEKRKADYQAEFCDWYEATGHWQLLLGHWQLLSSNWF
jgi:hypothetical protein